MATNHVMIDLETLGTVASAVIISIGAVKFDLESDEIDNAGFYASVSVESNTDLGRQVSEKTLLWWMEQSAEAQKVFKEPKQPLTDALHAFADWFGTSKIAKKNQLVWSNGADFDLPMMAHAYHLIGMEPPWEFWNSRCVRTYKNLPIAAKVTKPEPRVKHNALDDAYAQAQHVQAIQKAMRA